MNNIERVRSIERWEHLFKIMTIVKELLKNKKKKPFLELKLDF